MGPTWVHWALIERLDDGCAARSLKGTNSVNSTKLRPVMPVPIFHGDWSLIVRPAIQYFVNWTMNEIQLIAMAPNLRISGRADGGFDDEVSLPIGLADRPGNVATLKLAPLPVRWGLEVQYYLTPADGVTPGWNSDVLFAPIILNPSK